MEEKKKQSVQISQDTSWLIHVSGMPWMATKDEILEFFDDFKILNEVNGIHFIINETKNNQNEAFIQLVSEKDFQMAMNYKTERMGFSSVKSNIFYSF